MSSQQNPPAAGNIRNWLSRSPQREKESIFQQRRNRRTPISQNKVKKVAASLLFLLGIAGLLCAAEYPSPTEGDFVLHDFKFRSGETIAELRLHYRTLGRPDKDTQGKVHNAVLILHGTT